MSGSVPTLGFYLWDQVVAFGPGSIDVVDPWVGLAAAVSATSTIRLGSS